VWERTHTAYLCLDHIAWPHAMLHLHSINFLRTNVLAPHDAREPLLQRRLSNTNNGHTRDLACDADHLWESHSRATVCNAKVFGQLSTHTPGTEPVT